MDYVVLEKREAGAAGYTLRCTMEFHDHFSLAATLGNMALERLGHAAAVYDQARERGVFQPVEDHHWQAALGLSSLVTLMRRGERKHCIGAAILFQATMEKIPVFIPELGKGLIPSQERGFAAAWRDLITRNLGVADRDAALDEFNTYDRVIYKECRNPVIHGRTVDDLAKASAIRFPTVYEGIRAGWRAYDYLIAKALDGHQPSWAVACKTWGLPAELQPTEYPDLETQGAELLRWHSRGAERPPGRQ